MRKNFPKELRWAEIRKKIITKYDGHCQLCGKKCRDGELTIDHIKPKMKGGRNDERNLRLICDPCRIIWDKNNMDIPPKHDPNKKPYRMIVYPNKQKF